MSEFVRAPKDPDSNMLRAAAREINTPVSYREIMCAYKAMLAIAPAAPEPHNPFPWSYDPSEAMRKAGNDALEKLALRPDRSLLDKAHYCFQAMIAEWRREHGETEPEFVDVMWDDGLIGRNQSAQSLNWDKVVTWFPVIAQPSLPDERVLRDAIAGASVEEDNCPDNLAIALCSYFTNHAERPHNDPKTDDHTWGEWVEQKANEALDLIVVAIREAIKEMQK